MKSNKMMKRKENIGQWWQPEYPGKKLFGKIKIQKLFLSDIGELVYYQLIMNTIEEFNLILW